MNNKNIYEDYLNSDFYEENKELKSKSIISILFFNAIFIWGSIFILIDQGFSMGTLFISSFLLIFIAYLDYNICKNNRYILKKEESKREWITNWIDLNEV